MSWLKRASSNGFTTDIEKATIENTDYRRVLFTTHNSQLVLMSLRPGEEIGSEIHDLDQFFRFESGTGKIVLNGESHPIKDGSSVTVPEGVEHNVINTGDEDLKLYAIYSPPNHKRGTVHKTKADEKEEHFDGETDL
jgi:mannose-6-phosphate isomerase-like protein (cupin superfamily)